MMKCWSTALSAAYSITLTATLTSNNVGCLIGKGHLG